MWFKQVVPCGKLKGLRTIQTQGGEKQYEAICPNLNKSLPPLTRLITQLESLRCNIIFFFPPSDNFFLFYSVFGGSLSIFWHYINSLMQRKCLTIQAVLQISAGVLYPEPISTSKDRYCRVWMSSVKCLC